MSKDRHIANARTCISACVRTRALHLILFWMLVVPLIDCAGAQTHLVELINADEVAVETDSLSGTIRRLLGNVELRQDTILLSAARATQFEQRGEVFLEGAVRIISGDDTLTARRVTYDANNKVARAVGEVRISDGESILLAPSMTYFSQTKLATFSEGGRLLHEDAELTSPEGRYSTRSKVAELDGPVQLQDSTTVLTSAAGTYDAEAEVANFAGEVRLRRRGTSMEADSLVHNRLTEVSTAFGRVVVERFGDEEADPDAGAAVDSTRREILFGAFAEHRAASDSSLVHGAPGNDPLLVQLRTDSTGVTDTSLVRARRFVAAQVNSAAATHTEVTAIGAVRMDSPRLSAVADSARFERVEPDSASGRVQTDLLKLFGAERPLVWLEDAQVAGDTLVAFASGEEVERVDVFGNAFAAQLDTTLGRVRQIRGSRMRAVFEEDSLRTLSVWPDAEAIYYRATAEGLLDGADRLLADSLVFRFEEGRLADIFGVRNIEGVTYGPEIIPEPLRLRGYVYAPERRPIRAALLPEDGWEAIWLTRQSDTPPQAGEQGVPDPPIEDDDASG